VTAIPAVRNGGWIGMFDLSKSGAVFAVVSQRRDPDREPLDLQPSHLELIRPEGGAVHIADVGEDVDRQAGWGDVEGNRVAWMETPSTSLFEQPYEIYVAHTRGRDVTRIARETRLLPPPPTGTIPMLAGDRVYWAASDGDLDRPRTVRANVYSAPVTGRGERRTEARNAMMPSASGDYLVYARTSFVDRSMPDGRVEIHRRRISTGEDVTVSEFDLGREHRLGGLTSYHDTVAWAVPTESRGTSLLTIAEPGEEPLHVRSEGVHLGLTSISDSLAAWTEIGERGRQWVLDRRTGTVLELDRSPFGFAGVGVTVAGDRILWRPSERTWKVARVVP
jgi:hypothetical protein